MKKVFITGISGFIGSELAQRCIKEGYEVGGLIRQHPKQNEAVNALRGKAHLYEGDITDSTRLGNIIREFDPNYIVHFAALTRVSYSFGHEEETFLTNAGGTVKLVEAVKKHSTNLEKFIYASCFDEKTRAVTKDGLKYYNEIKEEDEVLSINTDTKEIEWKKINKIIKQKYKGKMISFKGKRYDLLVTPNHRMFFYKKNGIPFFEEAKKTIGRKSLIKLPVGEYNIGMVDDFFIFPHKERHWNARKEPEKIKMTDLFYLCGLFIADGTADRNPKKRKVRYHAKEFERERDENGRFIDTNMNAGIDTITYTNRIRFSVPEKDKARKRLEETLTKNGYKFSRYPHEIYLNSYNLFQIFKQCGSNAKEKHIPKWMFNYSKKYIVELYNGLMDGDGDKRYRTLTTISRQLRNECIELGFKIGKHVSYKKNRGGKVWFEKDKRFITGRDCYYIYFSSTSPSLYLKNSGREEYCGIVWCLDVPINHNFLVERNGKFVFSGNSMEAYGNQPEMQKKFMPFDETTELGVGSPYGVWKITGDYFMRQQYFANRFPSIVLRQTNTYGRKNDCYFVVEAFVTEMLKNPKVVNFGNPEPYRNFMHIDDLTNLYIHLFKSNNPKLLGKAFTVGPPNAISIKELAEKIAEKLNWKGKINWNTRELRDGEIYYLNSYNDLISRLTGWGPEITIDKGLDMVIEYWKNKLKEAKK